MAGQKMRLASLAVLFCVLSPLVCATTYTISPSGTYKDLNAVNGLTFAAGDVIEFAAGTYSGQQTFSGHTGTAANPIIIRPQANAKVSPRESTTGHDSRQFLSGNFLFNGQGSSRSAHR